MGNKSFLFFKYLLWFLAIILHKFVGITVGYYLVAGVMLIFLLADERRRNYRFEMQLLLYSVIFTDNYTIILVSVILWIKQIALKKKINKITFLILFYCVLTSVINFVPVVNFFNGMLYLLPVFALNYCMRIYSAYKRELLIAFNEIINVEIMATIVDWFMHVFYYRNHDPDWANGTMRYRTMYILMLIMTFTAIRYIGSGFLNNKKRELLYGICALVIVKATNCDTLTILIAGTLLVYIAFWKLKHANLFLPLTISIGGIFSICYLFAYTEIGRIFSNRDYLLYRVAKISAYKDVFITEPLKNVKYFFLGNGVGYGGSRGAVLCTGAYVDSYNKIFPVSISEFTGNYIYGRMPYINGNHDSILNLPYASMISIMSDLGMIGVMLFAYFILSNIQRNNFIHKLLVLALVVSCFVDYTLEFPKVMCVFYINLMLVNTSCELHVSKETSLRYLNYPKYSCIHKYKHIL